MEFAVDWSRLNRPQQRYLEDSRSPFVLLSAGFGTGKTTADALKILDLAARNPGVPGMIAAQSWTAVESTLLYRLRRLTGLPLPVHGRERVISLDGRTPIYVRTAEAYKFADGHDVGWFVGDEARHWPVKAWDVFKTRVRIPCPNPQTSISTTPVVGWLSDEFDTSKGGRAVVYGSTSENAHNLAPGYVENLEATWSPRMRRAALHGEFVILEGGVFEQFVPGIKSPWVEDYDEERWARNPCQVWIDPGFRRSAVLWVREHPTSPSTWIVFDQQMPENQPMTRVVESINALAKAKHRTIGDVVVDPAAKQADQATEITMRQVVRRISRLGEVRHPVGFYRGIEWGIERVRATLGDPDTGMPLRLRFSSALAQSETDPRMGGRGIMRSLAGMKYQEMRDGHAVSDKPAEDPLYEHAVDALRYGVVLLWLRNPDLRRMLIATEQNQGAGHATL